MKRLGTSASVVACLTASCLCPVLKTYGDQTWPFVNRLGEKTVTEDIGGVANNEIAGIVRSNELLSKDPDGPTISSVGGLWHSVERRFAMPPNTTPIPLAVGHPMIQTKGMVKGGGYLYISDTGKDANHDEPARIWKLDPSSGELKIFFTGAPLVNSKWLFYRKAKDGAPAMLVVSDYGVETSPRAPGTGEGAKVFTIHIAEDGTAGEVRVLHEGPPFQSPEGVTVIGDTIIVADWAAGGIGSRPDRPGLTFPTGRLFQLPLSGGVPAVLFEDHTWVVLIAACKYWIDGKLYLRMIDIDGGRADRSPLAYLPQSGTPAFYRAEVISTAPLRLGPLERTILAESGPVTLQFSELLPDDTIWISTSNRDTFDDGLTLRVVPAVFLPVNVDGTQSYTFIANSDITHDSLELSVEVIGRGITRGSGALTIAKDPQPSLRAHLKPMVGPAVIYYILDNKHAGSTGENGAEDENDDALSGRLQLMREVMGMPLNASADGTTRSVVMFPPGGGAYATLWRGAPLSQPMAVQFSDDAKLLYVSDQDGGPEGTSAIWTLPLPHRQQVEALFPPRSGPGDSPAIPVLSVSVAGEEIAIEFPSEEGILYQLQSSSDLITWVNFVDAALDGTGRTVTFTDSLSAGQKYYRVFIRVRVNP